MLCFHPYNESIDLENRFNYLTLSFTLSKTPENNAEKHQFNCIFLSLQKCTKVNKYRRTKRQAGRWTDR